jgi:hypothetical protein
MPSTASRAHVLVLSLLAAALAVTALLVTSTGDALAAAEDCTLTADPPASYYGIDTITSGSVDCASAKNTILFSIVLTRDGSVAASGQRRCHKASTCWSYLLTDDPPGDQLWCTHVSARVGSYSLAEVSRCEADPTL